MIRYYRSLQTMLANSAPGLRDLQLFQFSSTFPFLLFPELTQFCCNLLLTITYTSGGELNHIFSFFSQFIDKLDSICFCCQAQFKLFWFIFRYDGRLSFKDLNDNSLLNGVQTEALQKLWTPQLAFINALGPYQTVVDDLSVCTIVLEDQPSYDDMIESNECKKCYLPTTSGCYSCLCRLWF